MRNFWRVVWVIGLAACKLYGDPAAKMHTPDSQPAKPEAAAGPVYVKECPVDGPRVLKPAKPDEVAAAAGVHSSEVALAHYDTETNADQRVSLLKQSVDGYRTALVKDPYNVEATLGLAVAYDVAHRQGCALVMLHRLYELASHPKWSIPARSAIGRIGTTQRWFKDYRSEALVAVGL
jgi:hypothetical protein